MTQLTLQFGDVQEDLLPPEAMDFLSGVVPKNRSAKIKQDTEDIFEIQMPAKVSGYHTTYANGALSNFFDGALTNYFTKVNLIPKHKIPYLGTRVAHTPSYFKFERSSSSDLIVCDYGMYIHRREEEGSAKINTDDVVFRLWVHVVYDISPYEHRHHVVEDKSYFGLSSDEYSLGAHVSPYSDIDNFYANTMLTFPWQHLVSLDNSKSQWWQRMEAAIDAKLVNFLLFEPEKQKSYTTFVTNPGQQAKRKTISKSPLTSRNPGWGATVNTMAALSVASTDERELLDRAVAIGLGEGVKISPHFYKYLQEYYEAFFNGAGSDDFFSPDKFQSFLIPIKFLHTLITHYEDVSLIDMFPVQYWKRNEAEIWTARAGSYMGSVMAGIGTILSDSLFNVFPRAKQYRLLAEPFELRYQAKVVEMRQAEMPAATPRNTGMNWQNGGLNNIVYDHNARYNLRDIRPRGQNLGVEQPLREVLDLINMLKKIHEKDVSTAENIDARRVKTIKQYHDEAVKVYNKFRFKAIPIKSGLTQWLVDYGLEIPDTKLKIVIPEDTNTVREWGQTQGHCIGTYCEHMAQGSTMLLGVWDEETKDWFGHIQFQPFTTLDGDRLALTVPKVAVQQFYGKHNCGLPVEGKNAVITHLNTAIATFHKKLDEDLEKEIDIDV